MGGKQGGKRASAPTAEEFRDVMVHSILPAIEAKVAPLVRGKPLLSYNNATIHTKAGPMLQAAGAFTRCERVAAPAQSPDLQKVVEHTHGRIQQRWQRELRGDGQKVLSMPKYISRLRKIFEEVATPAMVEADVRSLPATYKAVIAAKGDWPEKEHR